jgi:hypothetical protein
MGHAKIILNWAFDWMEWFYGYSLFLYNSFLTFGFWLYHSCIHSLQIMVLYKALTTSGESRVFLITLGIQPCVHKQLDSCFLFDWTHLWCPIFYFVFDLSLIWIFLYSLQVSIVDNISVFFKGLFTASELHNDRPQLMIRKGLI